MKERLDGRANTPEYIEVVKTDIEDRGEAVAFTFEFPGQISAEVFDAMFDDPDSTVAHTIDQTLGAKGWRKNENWNSHAQMIDDGKVWMVVYERV